MSKRGQTLTAQAREQVVKLHEYFERESVNGGPLLPVSQPRERVAQALGIGRRTVSKILKEKYGSSGLEENVLRTPNKRKREKKVVGVGNFDAAAIRKHIYGYYSRKEHLTLRKLLHSLNEAGLFSGCITSLSKIGITMYLLKKHGCIKSLWFQRHGPIILQPPPQTTKVLTK